jgi:hypothetical protein
VGGVPGQQLTTPAPAWRLRRSHPQQLQQQAGVQQQLQQGLLQPQRVSTPRLGVTELRLEQGHMLQGAQARHAV